MKPFAFNTNINFLDPSTPKPETALAARTGGYTDSPMGTAMLVGSAAGTVLGAYHGYKRNDSVGWAVGWALLGGAFWPIALPVMYAQGFGEPHK